MSFSFNTLPLQTVRCGFLFLCLRRTREAQEPGVFAVLQWETQKLQGPVCPEGQTVSSRARPRTLRALHLRPQEEAVNGWESRKNVFS